MEGEHLPGGDTEGVSRGFDALGGLEAGLGMVPFEDDDFDERGILSVCSGDFVVVRRKDGGVTHFTEGGEL